MENKKQLKWYNYAAKIVLIVIFSLIAPILITIALAMGDPPLACYKEIWNG